MSLSELPMSREDTRIIFGNVDEVAVIANTFVNRLEEALGSLMDEEKGDDYVGALFLEVVRRSHQNVLHTGLTLSMQLPAMETPYKTYITQYPISLAHLNSLPPTPSLTAYLSRNEILASSLTLGYDLPSLLAMPVHRLLNYSTLLSAIIAETPITHSDKGNLEQAREKIINMTRCMDENYLREMMEGSAGPKAGRFKGEDGFEQGRDNRSRAKSECDHQHWQGTRIHDGNPSFTAATIRAQSDEVCREDNFLCGSTI